MIATRVAKNEDALKKYGVSIYDSNGQLKSTYQILTELSPAWEEMSNAERVALGNTLAGTNQYKILSAVMSQMKPELDGLSTAQKAYNQALNASGKTMEQNAVYMESIEAKTTALKAEFENLVISKGGLQDLAKVFIDLGTNALKLVNNLGGLKSVLIALAGVLLTIKADKLVLGFSKFSKSITTLIPRLTTAIGYFRQGRAEGLAFGDALKMAGIKASAAQVAIGALTTVITIGVMAWGAYQASIEKTNAALEQSRQEYEQYVDSLSSSVDKIQNEKASKEELIKINQRLKGSYSDEKQALIDVNDLRKENLHLLYLESQQKANEYITEHAEEAIKAQEYLNHTVKDSGVLFGQLTKLLTTQTLTFGSTAVAIGTVRNELDKIITLSPDEAYSKLTEKINELIKIQEENGSLTENQKLQLEEYTKALNTIKAQTEEAKVALEAYNNAKQVATQTEEEFIKTKTSGIEFDELSIEEQEKLIEKYEITEDEIQSLMESEEGLNYTRSEAIQLLAAEKEAAQEYEETSKELEETISSLAEALGITSTQLNVLKKRFDSVTLIKYLNNLAQIKQELSDTSTVVDNLQDALTTASDALAEYNQNGYLTIDTFQSLMGISAQYLAELVNENGQLEINQTTLGNLVDQLKIAKIEELAHAAALEIAALQYDDTDSSASSAEKSVDAAGNAFTRAGDKAAKASAGVALFNAELDKATGGTASDYTGTEKVIIEKYRKLAKEISTLTVNTTAAGNAASSAGKKGSKAAKDAKDATEELNKELEKYKKVISWISKQYDKEIDKIKKTKDEAIKAEEEKIKAKEKEKDAALDAIEKEINALEKEKKVLKEQKEELDARKQALKDEENTIVKGIEKRIKALEKERDALVKPVEERIKVLEKERDAIIESTQAEIDSLNELKEQRQTYWDEQIDALKKANQELKENLELQEKLDALEKAKNTKVKIYKEGQGFVYDVDQNAVQQAQKALDDYLSEKAYEDELARLESLKNAEIQSYDDRLKELNDYKDNTKKIYDQQIEDLKNYKDSVKENYDEQIENLKEYKEAIQEQYEEQIEIINQDIDALEKHMDELDKHKEALEEHKDAVEEQYEAEIAELEAHKDAVEKAYDAEIQMWENYKQEFENMVNAYEDEQNRLLFEQLTGIKAENSNWMTRLDNLAKFVNEYNKLQQQLETDNTNVQNTASFDNGSSSVGSSSPRNNNRATPRYDDRGFRLNNNTSSKPKYDSRGFKLNYASGVSSIPNDQIAIVGENPNQELVIGSKLNGQTMSLTKGAGVVNAESTNTLAGMLNQVGKYGNSGFGGGNGTLNNNYNNDSLVINGVTIQGANIKDPETFVNSLLNLKSEALQRAYQHK